MMSTLQDAVDLYGRVEILTRMCGASGEFMTEFYERIRKFGEAIMADFEVSAEDAAKLPMDTELKSEAEAHLTELKRWLYSQNPTHFEQYASV